MIPEGCTRLLIGLNASQVGPKSPSTTNRYKDQWDTATESLRVDPKVPDMIEQSASQISPFAPFFKKKKKMASLYFFLGGVLLPPERGRAKMALLRQKRGGTQSAPSASLFLPQRRHRRPSPNFFFFLNKKIKRRKFRTTSWRRSIIGRSIFHTGRR